MLTQVLEKVAQRESLSHDEMAAAIGTMVGHECPPPQIAALLMALRMKGEAPAELSGAAAALRARAVRPPIGVTPLLDVVGTGGDGAGSLNLSTAAAVVAAAAATESAFAIAAEGGRAMVADWFHSTAMRRVDGVAGPELEVTEALYFNPEGESTQRLEVRNYGATALSFTLDAPGGGFTADETTVQVEAGGVQTILVSSDGPEAAVVVGWQSDDPDEASGQVDLVPATSTVGTPHQDFSLQGFSWPDPSLSTFTLPEGEVTFLAYFATF